MGDAETGKAVTNWFEPNHLMEVEAWISHHPETTLTLDPAVRHILTRALQGEGSSTRAL
jgi:hypothetical protein